MCRELFGSCLELFYHLVYFSVRSHSFVVHGNGLFYYGSKRGGVAGVLSRVRADVGVCYNTLSVGYCFAQLHQYAHVLVRYLLDVPVAVACIIILVVGNQTRAVGIVRIEIPAAEYLVEVTCFLYEALCGLARAGYFHQAPGVTFGHAFYIGVLLHTAVFHHVFALGRNRYVPVAHGVEVVNHPVPEPIARFAVLRGPVRDKVIAVRLVHETVVALGEGHFLRLDFLNGSVYFPYHCFQVGNTGTYSGLGLAYNLVESGECCFGHLAGVGTCLVIAAFGVCYGLLQFQLGRNTAVVNLDELPRRVDVRIVARLDHCGRGV